MLSLPDRRQTTLVWLAAGVSAVLVLSYAVMLAGLRDDEVRRALVGDWLLVGGGLLAAACLAWTAWAAAPSIPRVRLAWGLLAAAVLAFVLGHSLRALADMGAMRLGALPLADWLQILFYVLAIAAVLYLP